MKWFMFALSAALFWGAYVVTVSYGQMAFPGGRQNPNSPIRAFVFIGLAYFVMAIVIPGIWLATQGVPSAPDGSWVDQFNMKGGILSFTAGALGALGALGVVFALKSGGTPIVVAPIVFSIAPIINVLIAWIIAASKGSRETPSLEFIVGIVIAIAGMVLVYRNSPVAHPSKASPPAPTVPTNGPGSTGH